MGDANDLTELLSREWIGAMRWDGFINYSRKNVDRMKEIYEATEIPADLAEEIKALDTDIRLLVIGADWCGDVVANAPSISKLADLNPKIQLRVVDRDRHEDLMNHFLTNGSKSIPKVILCTANMRKHKEWGPRPAECQAIMMEHKGKKPKEEIVPLIRDWYVNDKHQSVLKEIWAEIKAVANGA